MSLCAKHASQRRRYLRMKCATLVSSLSIVLRLSRCTFLQVADYAPPSFFTDSQPTVPAYVITETYIGDGIGEIDRDYLVQSYNRAAAYATQYDTSQLSIREYQLLSISNATGAQIYTDGVLGRVPWADSRGGTPFQGIRMVVQTTWDKHSTKIDEEHFDVVSSMQHYSSFEQIMVKVPIKEAWHNDMRVSTQSAPIWAHLPIGNLAGYQAGVQINGPGVAPVTSQLQNKLMIALFAPLAALCCISTADITEVHQSGGVSDAAQLTIAFSLVIGECALEEALPAAFANASFQDFFRPAESLQLTALLLWVRPAYEMGYPSTVYAPKSRGPGHLSLPGIIIIAVVSGILLATGVLSLVWGVFIRKPGLRRLQYTISKRNGKPQVLGKGSFGTVYRGKMNGSLAVAIKVIHMRTEVDLIRFQAEAKILESLSDLPHIVKSYPSGPNRGQTCHIIMELMEGGDLDEALHHAEEAVTWTHGGWELAAQIALGLSGLHERKVVHRDLKPRNILLVADRSTAKIGDVGLARTIVDSHLSTTSTITGTFAYAAPEILARQRCNEKVDIFSLGIVLLEMLTGQYPERCCSLEEQMHNGLDVSCRELIKACCHIDPCQRPSARQVYEWLVSM